MRSIKTKHWLLGAIILIGLGLITEKVFFSPLLAPNIADAQESIAVPTPAPTSIPTAAPNASPTTNNTNALPPADDNFRQVLVQCYPNTAAWNVVGPEAYYEAYKKNVGVRKTDREIENYHLRLADGSERRIQVLPSDNTNSQTQKEFRLFKLDAQGMPERLPLQTGETLDRLLAQGELFNREWKERTEMNDGSVFMVEVHNNSIFEFQHAGSSNTFSCRGKSCVCQ